MNDTELKVEILKQTIAAGVPAAAVLEFAKKFYEWCTEHRQSGPTVPRKVA